MPSPAPFVAIPGGGTVKPPSWGKKYPGRGGDTGKGSFYELAAGIQRVTNQLMAQYDDVLDDVTDALWDVLDEEILRPANEWCPIKTGALRASAWVNVQRRGWYVTGMVGYDTDYAIYVHEVPARHAPPTRWKWLEETLAVRGERTVEALRQRVERANR